MSRLETMLGGIKAEKLLGDAMDKEAMEKSKAAELAEKESSAGVSAV